MSFTKGSVTLTRFKASGSPRMFDESHVERLAGKAIGRSAASADGSDSGWTAGASTHDTAFSLEANVYGDFLSWDLCVEANKIPADNLHAYYVAELAALAAWSPSGLLSARQKREAKEAARARIEDEAKDGRYKRRKCVPVLWDRETGEVWLGTTSGSIVGTFSSLFKDTFGEDLELLTAHWVADEYFAVTELSLTAFIPGASSEDVSWIPDEASRDWLGNEFLLWLWYYTDVQSDTLTAGDSSDITVMLSGGLTLDCPRGQTGLDTFRHEGPTRLPEAKRAIQSGKLPRKAGLTLVRHDQQYGLSLQAESWAVSSAKLPPTPEDISDARGLTLWRFEQTREMVRTVDLLYQRFLDVRVSPTWGDEVADMRDWLGVSKADAA